MKRIVFTFLLVLGLVLSAKAVTFGTDDNYTVPVAFSNIAGVASTGSYQATATAGTLSESQQNAFSSTNRNSLFGLSSPFRTPGDPTDPGSGDPEVSDWEWEDPTDDPYIDDPGYSPVGNLPWILMLLLAAAYALFLSHRRKESRAE